MEQTQQKRNRRHKIGINSDGGGVKGIITLILYKYLEKELGHKLHRYVDFVSGASTGTIVGTGIASGKFWCEELFDMYLEETPKIFEPRLFRKGLFLPRYSAEPLENMLEKAFGEMKIQDLIVDDCLFVSVNATKRKYVLHKKIDDELKGDYLKDVCRWSAGAPSYFPIAYRNGDAMIDGGMAMNSPAMMLFTAMIEEAFPENKSLISVGTGKYEYKVDAKPWWGLAKWLVPLFDIMLSESVDITDRYLKTQFDPRFKNEGKYFRFNTNLVTANSKMDDASPKNLGALVAEGNKMLEANKKNLECLIKLLSENEK